MALFKKQPKVVISMRVEPEILKFIKDNKIDRSKVLSKEIKRLKQLPINKLDKKIQKKRRK